MLLPLKQNNMSLHRNWKLWLCCIHFAVQVRAAVREENLPDASQSRVQCSRLVLKPRVDSEGTLEEAMKIQRNNRERHGMK